jgi:hypothetical protein
MDPDHPDSAGDVGYDQNSWLGQLEYDPSENHMLEEGELHVAAAAVVGDKRPRDDGVPEYSDQEILEWQMGQQGEPAPPSQNWIQGNGGGYPQDDYQVTQLSDANPSIPLFRIGKGPAPRYSAPVPPPRGVHVPAAHTLHSIPDTNSYPYP